MDSIAVVGGNRLVGTIPISGAKNAALPIMTASLLTKETLALSNVPNLMDIVTMSSLLTQHGVDLKIDNTYSSESGRIMLLNAKNIDNLVAPYDIVRKMRASVLVMGPLLARFGEAKVSLPGGCAIGTRPIDLHLYGLEQLGASVQLDSGYVYVSAKDGLKGAHVNFSKVSVGATENIMMAACLAKGNTVISNAAIEPEVTDLANCLVAMGAKIHGIGTKTLEIEGVSSLHGASHSIVADRIEAGTYAVAAGITGGDILLTNIDYSIVENVFSTLAQTGLEISQENGGIRVKAPNGKIRAIDITTEAYPGFATDMQAQYMALMCLTDGASVINEHIFENRFMHVSELLRLGANIAVNGSTAIVRGVDNLKAAELMATDLRASVSLILAALAATGESIINRVYHLDRGYEDIESKLRACGANIRRIAG